MNNNALKTVLLFVVGASTGGVVILATRQPAAPPPPDPEVVETTRPPAPRDTQLAELKEKQYAALRRRQRATPPPIQRPARRPARPTPTPVPKTTAVVPSPTPARTALPAGLTPDQQLAALQRRHINQLDNADRRPLDLRRKTNPLVDMIVYAEPTLIPPMLLPAQRSETPEGALEPRPDVPDYEVLHRIQEYRSTRVYAEVLVPALTPTADHREVQRIAQAIADYEGFHSLSVYCTREARTAKYDMDYATAHPDALPSGYLGDLERGRFRPYRR